MMAGKKTKPLKRVQWRVEYAAFLVVERLVCLLSMKSLWRIGASLSCLAYLFRSRWPIVRNNLRTVLGPKVSEDEIASLSREVFRHTTANFLTALKGGRLSSPLVQAAIIPTDFEILERAIEKGKGVILVSPHMGNFELLTQGLGASHPELNVAAIYRPLNNIYLDPLIRKRRSNHRMRMFSKFTSYQAPIKFVRDKGILGIIADQRAGRSGTIVPFFGRLMSMSPLPAFIHKHTGAPVVGISMRTVSPGKWEVRFHEPDVRDGENLSTPHVAALLERATRQSLVDVFWMHDLWRIDKRRPLEIAGKKGPLRLRRQPENNLRPFSVLARIPDNPTDFRQTLPALKAMSASRPDFELHLLGREQIRHQVQISEVPHVFHSVEDDFLPANLPIALILTDDERAARELGRLYDGPVYSLPETMQSGDNWRQVPHTSELSRENLWLQLARKLGMHEPPLRETYL
tara:strand:+ start:871 stop:2250 length:1380 start_codon:yes stop_codon:yes gene_type:complete